MLFNSPKRPNSKKTVVFAKDGKSFVITASRKQKCGDVPGIKTIQVSLIGGRFTGSGTATRSACRVRSTAKDFDDVKMKPLGKRRKKRGS